MAALVADRRPRGRRDPGRAQRAGAVGRVDHHRVLVAEEDVMERVVHVAPRTAARARAPSRSVRPTAPTSSEPPVSSRNGSSARDVSDDGVADVLGRVPGRVERPEADRPDLEGLAVADRAVLVCQLGAGADDVGRAGQGREVAAARDVVVVEVGLDDVADPQTGGPCRLEVDVDVAPRIHDRRGPGRLIGDERRQMAEPLDPVLGDTHRRSLYRGRPMLDSPTARAATPLTSVPEISA